MEAARNLVATELGLDPAAVGPDAGIGTLPQWDSLGHMRILLAIERRLGRELDAETAVAIATVGDVAALLGRPG